MLESSLAISHISDTLYKCTKCGLQMKASEAIFHDILSEIKHWSKWIPIVVSILALIVSIIAIVIKK